MISVITGAPLGPGGVLADPAPGGPGGVRADLAVWPVPITGTPLCLVTCSAGWTTD